MLVVHQHCASRLQRVLEEQTHFHKKAVSSVCLPGLHTHTHTHTPLHTQRSRIDLETEESGIDLVIRLKTEVMITTIILLEMMAVIIIVVIY